MQSCDNRNSQVPTLSPLWLAGPGTQRLFEELWETGGASALRIRETLGQMRACRDRSPVVLHGLLQQQHQLAALRMMKKVPLGTEKCLGPVT